MLWVKKYWFFEVLRVRENKIAKLDKMTRGHHTSFLARYLKY